MEIIPTQRVDVARQGALLGSVSEYAKIDTDEFNLLFAAGLDQDGLLWEQNSGYLINSPYLSWTDFGLSQTANGVFGSATPGVFDEWTERATGTKGLKQVSAAAGVEAWAESNTAIMGTSQSFAVKLQLSPCPPTAASSRTRDGCYRMIVWPSDAAAGTTTYRVIFRFSESPRLEYTTDGGAAVKAQTATWTVAGDIPGGGDPAKIRNFDNLSVTIVVLQIEGYIVVWAGTDLTRGTLAFAGPRSEAGKLLVAGKNGYWGTLFAPMWFKAEGRYISPVHRGPRSVADPRRPKQFLIQPDPKAGGAGTAVTGVINDVDASTLEYTYALTLSAPPLTAPNDGYSLQSPAVRQVTVNWPTIGRPPQSAPDWAKDDGVTRIEELLTFDPGSGMYRSQWTIESTNDLGENAYQAGLSAVRVYLGYQHTGLFLRGIGLGRVSNVWEANGGQSSYKAGVGDLSFVVERQELKDDLYPRDWCIFSLARFLFEQGQLNPAILLRIPQCAYGPNPPCNHPKMPPHPGWKAGLKILSAIGELREIAGAWWGQDPDGFERFELFDWTPIQGQATSYLRQQSGVIKVFSEGPTSQSFDSIRYPGGDVNEVGKGLVRTRMADAIRNEIILQGFDQTTGRLMTTHFENTLTLRSQFDPTYAGYLGFAAPLYHAWSGYSTQPFMEFVAGTLGERVALPDEQVQVPCYGQPDLYPMDVIGVRELRTVGPGSYYWITSIQSVFDMATPDVYTSRINGMWINNGLPPGYAS